MGSIIIETPALKQASKAVVEAINKLEPANLGLVAALSLAIKDFTEQAIRDDRARRDSALRRIEQQVRLAVNAHHPEDSEDFLDRATLRRRAEALSAFVTKVVEEETR